MWVPVGAAPICTDIRPVVHGLIPRKGLPNLHRQSPIVQRLVRPLGVKRGLWDNTPQDSHQMQDGKMRDCEGRPAWPLSQRVWVGGRKTRAQAKMLEIAHHGLIMFPSHPINPPYAPIKQTQQNHER